MESCSKCSCPRAKKGGHAVGDGKKEKAEDFSSAVIVVSRPQATSNLSLLQRGFGSSTSRRRRDVVTNNRIRNRAEGTYASGVLCERIANGLMTGSRGAAHTNHLERIAALGTGR